MSQTPSPPTFRNPRTPFFLSILLSVALLPSLVSSQNVTLYTSRVIATTTAGAATSTYTGLPAYDPTRLTAPDPPQPPINSYTLSLPSTPELLGEQGLFVSIPQQGNFLGFSIELSVANTILGKSAGTLKPEFLNYLANIQNRAGAGPIIRVGGNTQDSSTIYPQGLSDGSSIQKFKDGQDRYGNAITTPVINYSPELLYTMSNISGLVNAQWYFGLAFNESDVANLTGNQPIAAEYAQRILGTNLKGLVVGNEPDLYVDHNHRPEGWNVSNYMEEYNTLTQEILTQNVLSNTTAFVGPSLCCQEPGFMLQDVINAGYLDETNSASLAAVTVQHYPTNNCQLSGVINAQDIFASFLNHTSAQSLTALYTNDVALVRAAGKEIVMLEMNTASCGGFAGLSDSFGAAMWMADWAFQMAYANFSAALMHVGGQNVYYNPFTPPPSTVSSLYQWTTGSVYYSTLLVAEAFGKSGNARIVDLAVDSANIYHPAYAVYEGDAPTRVVLFNYITDATGASDIRFTLNLNGSTIGSSVHVRYLSASSVSEQYNITWAGQNMGTSFSSDGRLYGDLNTVEVQCTDGNCVIPVPAPSIALVYLTQDALDQSSVAADATSTYATTVIGEGSATVDPASLETSNGKNGGSKGSTSKGSASAANRRMAGSGVGAIVGLCIALLAVGISL